MAVSPVYVENDDRLVGDDWHRGRQLVSSATTDASGNEFDQIPT